MAMLSAHRWFATIALLAPIASCDLAAAASLDVEVSHLRPTTTVTVAVYPDAESWNGGAPLATRQFRAREPRQTLRIDGLPPGRYAVKVRQEPNPSSVELPSFSVERHGHSGRATSERRPSFERAAVEVGAEGARIPVHMFITGRP
jgi:uncharacterized protein (DUF2141 family)